MAGILGFAITPAVRGSVSAFPSEQTIQEQDSGIPDLSSLTGTSLPDRFSKPGLYALVGPMGGRRDNSNEEELDESSSDNEQTAAPDVQEEQKPVYHSIEDEPAVYFGEDDSYEGDFVLDVDFINSYEYQQCSDMIFLGDSRVVGMAMSAGGYHYIGKVSMGYQWLVSEGISLLRGKMDEYPQADIVLCMGINDLGNIDSYIAYYRSLIDSYPGRRFWFLSVNPVSERLAAAHGYTVRNPMIEAFNARLQAAFPDRYIDCYSYLMENGVGTGDGIHYAGNTYSAIQDFSWRAISAQLDRENESIH